MKKPVALSLNPRSLKLLREKTACSRETFGHFLGVSQITVVRWEQGESEPKGLQLAVLSALAIVAEKFNERANLTTSLHDLIAAGLHDRGNALRILFSFAYPPPRER